MSNCTYAFATSSKFLTAFYNKIQNLAQEDIYLHHDVCFARFKGHRNTQKRLGKTDLFFSIQASPLDAYTLLKWIKEVVKGVEVDMIASYSDNDEKYLYKLPGSQLLPNRKNVKKITNAEDVTDDIHEVAFRIRCDHENLGIKYMFEFMTMVILRLIDQTESYIEHCQQTEDHIKFVKDLIVASGRENDNHSLFENDNDYGFKKEYMSIELLASAFDINIWEKIAKKLGREEMDRLPYKQSRMCVLIYDAVNGTNKFTRQVSRWEL